MESSIVLKWLAFPWSLIPNSVFHSCIQRQSTVFLPLPRCTLGSLSTWIKSPTSALKELALKGRTLLTDSYNNIKTK